MDPAAHRLSLFKQGISLGSNHISSIADSGRPSPFRQHVLLESSRSRYIALWARRVSWLQPHNTHHTRRTSWLSGVPVPASACVPRAGDLGSFLQCLFCTGGHRHWGHQLEVSVARLTQSELPAVPHWLGYWRAQTMPHTCGARAVSASCAWLAVLPSGCLLAPPVGCQVSEVKDAGLIACGPALECGRTLTVLKPAMQGRHKLSAANCCDFRNTVASLQGRCPAA